MEDVDNPSTSEVIRLSFDNRRLLLWASMVHCLVFVLIYDMKPDELVRVSWFARIVMFELLFD